ncbi:hypothetical protein L6452_09525 [Arctium lappa]|uniref:Uncharacterized protein n=1 Tax=Arctium lappa TaxID=4217 RepID=A0ACB9DKQ2_ARCLA|nr:hypothetical protein L6452_09525 [Arctium lappa]
MLSALRLHRSQSPSICCSGFVFITDSALSLLLNQREQLIIIIIKAAASNDLKRKVKSSTHQQHHIHTFPSLIYSQMVMMMELQHLYTLITVPSQIRPSSDYRQL